MVSHMEKGGFVGSMAFMRFSKKLSQAAHASDDGHYDYKDGGMFRKAWESFLNQFRKGGSVLGEVAQTVVGDKKLKRQDTVGLERSTSTVTATSDVSAAAPPRWFCWLICWPGLVLSCGNTKIATRRALALIAGTSARCQHRSLIYLAIFRHA